MVKVVEAPSTYEAAAKALARWHGEGQKPRVTIYLFPDPAQGVVRLLEVSDGFPETGEILPLTIGPTPELPFASTAITVTREEFRQVGTGRLRLPPDWDWDRKRRVWPDDRG